MWTAESLRYTVFFKEPPIAGIAEEWWRATYGGAPETEVKKLGGASYRAEAPIERNQLILALDATSRRADWVLAPQGPQSPNEEPPAEPLTVGGFEEASDTFSKIIGKWLEFKLQVRRMAFGAILLIPTKDRAEGYSKVAQYLESVRIDPAGSSDFIYQINRPRTLPIPQLGDITINRLSKWTIAVIQRIAITLTPAGSNVVPTHATAAGDAVHAIRLELDVNTAADFEGVLPEDALRPTFQLLVNLAAEIAERGDVP